MNEYHTSWIITNLHTLAQEFFEEEVNEGHEYIQNSDFRAYCEQEAFDRVQHLQFKYQ